MRRLKNYCRSTMYSKRFDSLALMHINKEINFEPKEIIDKFASQGDTRLELNLIYCCNFYSIVSIFC